MFIWMCLENIAFHCLICSADFSDVGVSCEVKYIIRNKKNILKKNKQNNNNYYYLNMSKNMNALVNLEIEK